MSAYFLLGKEDTNFPPGKEDTNFPPEPSLQATAPVHEADSRPVGRPAPSAPGKATRRGAGLLKSRMPGMHT